MSPGNLARFTEHVSVIVSTNGEKLVSEWLTAASDLKSSSPKALDSFLEPFFIGRPTLPFINRLLSHRLNLGYQQLEMLRVLMLRCATFDDHLPSSSSANKALKALSTMRHDVCAQAVMNVQLHVKDFHATDAQKNEEEWGQGERT